MLVLLIYIGGAAFIGLIGLTFYLISVQTRKRYTCPACGERLQTEHMNASHCNMCGAPLDRVVRD
jgi:ribosomal protein S27AE